MILDQHAGCHQPAVIGIIITIGVIDLIIIILVIASAAFIIGKDNVSISTYCSGCGDISSARTQDQWGMLYKI